MTRKQEMSYI